MDRKIKTANKTEKILEGDPFFVILESTVYFKTYDERIGICLDEISNVRIIKNSDTTFNITLSILTTLFYILSKSIFLDLNFVFKFLYIVVISILIILIFSIKNFTYKLLINTGKTGFNEIPISKSNVQYAKNFVSKFYNTNTSQVNKQESHIKCKDFKAFYQLLITRSVFKEQKNSQEKVF